MLGTQLLIASCGMFWLVDYFIMSAPSFCHVILKLHISWKREGAFLHIKAAICASEWHSSCIDMHKSTWFIIWLTSAFSSQQSSLLQRLRLSSCACPCHTVELEQTIFLLLMWACNATFGSMTNATLIEYTVAVNGFTTAQSRSEFGFYVRKHISSLLVQLVFTLIVPTSVSDFFFPVSLQDLKSMFILLKSDLVVVAASTDYLSPE